MNTKEVAAALLTIGGGALLLFGLGVFSNAIAFYYGVASNSSLSANIDMINLSEGLNLVGSGTAAVGGLVVLSCARKAMAAEEGAGRLAVMAGIVGAGVPAVLYAVSFGVALATQNQAFFTGADQASSALSSSGTTLGIPFGLVIAGAVLLGTKARTAAGETAVGSQST